MKFPIRPPLDYQSLIPNYILEAQKLAVSVFGPIDSHWWFSHHYCQPPNGPGLTLAVHERSYSIRLSERALSDWWACMHEIGHEAVHTLSPVHVSRDTNLEEGAACVMAVRYRLHVTGNLVSGPSSGIYARPFHIVDQLLSSDPTIIARCRADGRSFVDISPDDLRREGAPLSHDDINFLCSRFETI